MCLSLRCWNVTFTKHLKQKLKHKVYCDGFLSLRTPTGKVMPYDDSEQLLECRILKNDEVIFSEFWLSFWCEVHYNPLYEIQDAPITEKETLDILEEVGRS
ncbi:hypothetical protein ACJRO7_032275 [Eucalyptus globulus]|uniref:5'-3' DNA helicase ZGRF1-like N-terminal domain-containing protein n=1 Tax=Eucalyptus globulus TaxID=34317 RepID=A0ABD3JJB8_EUCGL